MPPLTEEQKKKIRELKLKGKPVSFAQYSARKRGIEPTPFGSEAKRIQSEMPSVGEVAGAAGDILKDVARKPIDALTIPAKIGIDAAKSIGTGIKGLHEGQQQRLKTVGKYGIGSTKTLDTGEQVSEPSKLPTGAMSTLPEPMGGTADPVTQPGVGEPSATDTGRDEVKRTISDRPMQKFRGARPSGTQQIAGYEVSGMSPEEAKRFGAPVARPATRAERGLTPVGPNNGGRGFGARPRDEGPDLNRKIAPPRSPGDQIRYRREVRELESDRKAATETARTGEISARTDIAGERLAGEQEQQAFERDVSQQDRQKMESLQQEFANPETTEERRGIIEREIGVISGKPMTQRSEKSMEMTDKQRADTFRDIEKSDSYLKWKKSKQHRFSEDEPSAVQDYINAERPELKYLVTEERDEPTATPLPATGDRIPNKTTAVGNDGVTRVWTGTGWKKQG